MELPVIIRESIFGVVWAKSSGESFRLTSKYSCDRNLQRETCLGGCIWVGLYPEFFVFTLVGDRKILDYTSYDKMLINTKSYIIVNVFTVGHVGV